MVISVRIPPPPPPPIITKIAFRDRFTSTEKEDLQMAAVINPSDTAQQKRQASKIQVWLEDIRSSDYIDLTNTRVINGVNAMETVGIIGAGRAAEILSLEIREEERYRWSAP
jgi:hypothetical protein